MTTPATNYYPRETYAAGIRDMGEIVRRMPQFAGPANKSALFLAKIAEQAGYLDRSDIQPLIREFRAKEVPVTDPDQTYLAEFLDRVADLIVFGAKDTPEKSAPVATKADVQRISTGLRHVAIELSQIGENDPVGLPLVDKASRLEVEAVSLNLLSSKEADHLMAEVEKAGARYHQFLDLLVSTIENSDQAKQAA